MATGAHTAPVLHAVFERSASGCLKRVLGSPRRDGVIYLDDDLSIGPIDRTDGETRTRWLREQFGGDAYESAANIDHFWSDIASPDNHIVAYVSRRNAGEYAGLLELLRRRADAPLELVDVTDVGLADAGRTQDLEKALGIAELAPEEVISRGLLDSAAPLSASATLGHAQTWARLREENASLRIVENGTLVSAPISHFDARIVSFATPEWQSCARMLDAFYRTARAEGLRAPDLRFVLSRLAALVQSGQLEAQGNVATLDGSRHGSLRLPH